jgi:SAM-dependent methyltransferase
MNLRGGMGSQSMSLESTINCKTLIRVPVKPEISRAIRLGRALLGACLSPIYWLLAYRNGAPGLKFRRECAMLALRLLLNGKSPLSYSDIYRMLFWPIDSTRYFEFQFMWDAVSGRSHSHYLDVSSPCLFPLMATFKQHAVSSELINPDLRDLGATKKLVKALQLEGRCRLHGCLISAAPFAKHSFDLITSISVVEHITRDTEAIREMWNLLRPGGRLLLTLPCAAESSEQYIDRDEYGLMSSDDDGFFFFQRLYDQELLQERIFSVTGMPFRQVVYGEKLLGSHRRCLERKWGDPFYPSWKEPYMIGRDFCYFNNLNELPGEGVIGLEFEKHA